MQAACSRACALLVVWFCLQVGRGKARSTRGRALAGVAGASILLALAAVTMAVQKSGPNRLLQLGPVQISNIEINHLRRAVEPFTNLAHKTMAKAMTFPALMLGDAKSSAPHAKPLRAVAEPAEQPVKSFDSGVVYYYMPPASGNGAKLAKTAANAAAVEAAAFGHSKLQHLAAASQILAAPPPGVVVAPNVGGAPTVRSLAQELCAPCRNVLLMTGARKPAGFQTAFEPESPRLSLTAWFSAFDHAVLYKALVKFCLRPCAVRYLDSADPVRLNAKSLGQVH